MNNTSAEFSRWDYRNIALAAVTQCALLVNELAVHGRADTRELAACVEPLMVLNPDSTADVYPRPADLSNGINTLQLAMGSSGNRNYAQPVRYLLGMMVLQQKLSRLQLLQLKIRNGLLALQDRSFNGALNETEVGSAALFAEIAQLYQNTISTLTYRIHVAGNPEHLRDQQVADQIRTLLLAGIRSAMLWHQLGGRRWHLLFYRKRIRENLAHIRRALMTVNPDTRQN